MAKLLICTSIFFSLISVNSYSTELEVAGGTPLPPKERGADSTNSIHGNGSGVKKPNITESKK